MATNREKYIDNVSNEKLSLLLGFGAILKDNKLSTPLQIDIEKRYNFDERVKLAQNSKDIQEWLSQEAEEDKDHTIVDNLPNEIKKIELTEQAYKDILARFDKLEKYNVDEVFKNIFARLDTLEKKTFNAISDEEYKRVYKRYGEDLMKDFYRLEEDTTEKDKTADEMFEELRYKRIEANHNWYIAYQYEEEIGGMTACERIIIDTSHNLYRYAKQDREERSCVITEAEDKAIHKKIEELKNG